MSSRQDFATFVAYLRQFMQAIELKGMTFFAYHGVLEQERRVGNHYTVDLKLYLDLSQAMLSDELSDTINYAEVYARVQDEMNTPSQLIEHVAGRIIRRLHQDFPRLTRIDLRLAKKNPPMGADLEEAAITVSSKQ